MTQYDITNANDENYIDIDKIGADEKFIKFKKYINQENPDDYFLYSHESMILFRSGSLECKSISPEEKETSLVNMFKYLKIHIDKIVDRDVKIFKEKRLREEHEKLHLNDVKEKLKRTHKYLQF